MSSVTLVTMRRWLARTEGAATAATLLATGIVAGVAAVIAGSGAVQSAALGAGDVVVFFALGAVIDTWALRRFKMMGIFGVLGGYGLRIALMMAVAYLLAGAALLPSNTWFAIGAAVATIAWLVGLLAGHVTGRWPIYDLGVSA